MESLKLVDVKKKVEAKVKRSGKKIDFGCSGCSLRQEEYVPPEDFGEGELKYLVLVDAPSLLDAREKRPLMTVAGGLLREVLSRIPYKCRIMHAVNCFPKDKNGTARLPSNQEAKRCLDQFIKDELDRFDVVLLVGEVALNVAAGEIGQRGAFNGSLSLKDVMGSVVLAPGKKLIPVMHPENLYRLANYPKTLNEVIEKPVVREWMNDIFKVMDVLEDKALPFTVEVVSEQNVEAVKKELSRYSELTIDVETSSLDVLNCALYSTAIAGPEGSIYVVTDVELLKKLWGVVETRKIVMHNASFDYSVLYAKDFKLENTIVYDTMILASMIDENRRFTSFRLKDLVKFYLKYKYWRLIPDVSKLAEFDLQSIVEYNGEDVYVTRELFKFFKGRLLTDKQFDFADRVMSNGIKVVSELERTGILVDESKVQEVIDECEGVMRRCNLVMEEELASYGDRFKDLSLSSPTQLGNFLEEVIGEVLAEQSSPPLEMFLSQNRTAKTKRLGTSVHVLVGLVERLGDVEHAKATSVETILKALMEFRTYDKLKGTFLDSFIRHLGPDRRVRARYHLLGTRTGRLSSSNPNMQNIPKRLRKVFVPRPGFKFLEADLSQAEIRVAAIIAQDPVLHEIYKKGLDVHISTAAMAAGVTEQEVTSDMRQKAKAVNFGFLYGMQAPGFRGYAKAQYGAVFSQEEAENVRAGYFQKYFGLAEWHKNTAEWIRKYGYVESPFGRVYSFDMKDYDFNGIVRKALNFPVQGTASDLNLYLMGQMYQWKVDKGYEAYFVSTVHDSVVIEVREENINEAQDKLMEIAKGMEKDFDWVSLPIGVDSEIKERWG